MKRSLQSDFSNIGYGREDRASYACHPPESRGRFVAESESPTRTPFQRDRDRIIHSTAFRRLKHKTQVFIFHEGDHYRTRLTHTIEVAQIARSIARALRLDEDLAEALALAHDLGHTPFGHAGEDVLHDCLIDHGGFDHNAHTLRIVTALEQRYANFDGLNLSWETLEGIVKHNGPLCDIEGNPVGKTAKNGVPYVIAHYSKMHDLKLHTYPSLEAQAAAIADDIAYNAHDIDDGLRGGLFTLDDLHDVPLIDQILEEIDKLYPDLEPIRQNHELVRRVITRLVEDVIQHAQHNLGNHPVESVDHVRHQDQLMIRFSPEMTMADQGIKTFLFARMYRTEQMNRIRRDAQSILHDLYHHYLNHPSEMSDRWREGLSGGKDDHLARRVGDYVAGMTDRFAIEEHARMFDATPNLR